MPRKIGRTKVRTRKTGPKKRNTWGGARPGAGRKPTGEFAGVRHEPRKAIASRYPLVATMRLVEGLPNLRRKGTHEVIQDCIYEAQQPRFRVVHYSVQKDHLHMIVEGSDRESLSGGLQGMMVRLARALNREWGRKGKVFGDRYKEFVLRTPAEVRCALLYVLFNARRHGLSLKEGVDPFSSGPWFDGWRERIEPGDEEECPVEAPRTALLRKDWRRRGRIGLHEALPEGWEKARRRRRRLKKRPRRR